MRFKVWVTAVVAGWMVLPISHAADMKIAVVNGTRVLKQYYKTDLADQHMQEQLEDFAAERDKLLAQHKKLKQEFETLKAEAENKALTDEGRQKKKEQAEDKLAAVIEYEETIRDKATSRKKQLEGEGRNIHEELARAIRTAVKSCAEKGGYSLVLESGGLLANGLEPVLYSDPKFDITEDVIKILNADKPAVKE